MFGHIYCAKLIMASMLMGSALLFLQHSGSGMQRAYNGNDAILRGMIFTIIFQNPTTSFYLLPLPISIPAWSIAAIILVIDFLSFNVAGFGGVSASYLLLNFLHP